MDTEPHPLTLTRYHHEAFVRLIGALAADVWNERTIREHIAELTDEVSDRFIVAQAVVAALDVAGGVDITSGYEVANFADHVHAVWGLGHEDIVGRLRRWAQDHDPEHWAHDPGKARDTARGHQLAAHRMGRVA